MSGNQALNINYGIGGVADLAISSHGSDVYWAVCAVMTVSTLIFMGMSFGRPRSHRLFHYITAAITLVAAIAYYTMASGLGQVPIAVEFARPDSALVYGAQTTMNTREIFYVRYIDWFITTPLLLLDLLLTCGMPLPTLLITILLDEVMVVCGLVAFFYVLYSLVFIGRSHARALGAGPHRVFMSCGVLTLGIWLLYPIAWGLSEGGNVISPDGEAAFYGTLDIIAKPVFGFLLIFGHRNINPSELGLNIRDVAETGNHGTAAGEKHGMFRRNRGAMRDGNATTTAGTNGANTAV